MKLSIIQSAIKHVEKEFDEVRIDVVTGEILGEEKQQELDEQAEDSIRQLKNKERIVKYQNIDAGGRFLQAEKRRKSAQFVKDMDENKDVSGMVDELNFVDAESVKKKIKKAATAEDLDLLFTANDPDFSPLMRNYCNKTGRFLFNVKMSDLKRIVNVTGKEKALEILRLNAVQHTALEWLCTDPDSLNKLMINDCAGYFIYCSGLIFHNDYIVKTSEGTAAPNVSNKNLDETASLIDGLSGFTHINPLEQMSFYQLPETAKNRYVNLVDKFRAQENLAQMLFDVDNQEVVEEKILLMRANELMRRLLGLASSTNIAKMGVFQTVNLQEITSSSAGLVLFISELQAVLKTVFIQFFKGMHHTKAEFVINKLRTRSITAANIAAIKAEFKGRSNLHKQPKIKNLSNKQKQEQAILHDLMNFWDTQPEMGFDAETSMQKADDILGCVFAEDEIDEFIAEKTQIKAIEAAIKQQKPKNKFKLSGAGLNLKLTGV